MSKYLEILGVKSSGVGEAQESKVLFIDDEIIAKASKLNADQQKINFLKEILNKTSNTLPKTIKLFVELNKSEEVNELVKYIVSEISLNPASPHGYLLLSKIASDHSAFLTAKEILKIVNWLLKNDFSEYFEEYNRQEKELIKNLQSGVSDKSMNQEFRILYPNYSWILESIYYVCGNEKSFKYFTSLLDLYPIENSLLLILEILKYNDNQYKKVCSYVLDKKTFSENLKSLATGLLSVKNMQIENAKYNFFEILRKDPLNTHAISYLSLCELIIGDLIQFSNQVSKIAFNSEALPVALKIIFSSLNGFSIGMEKDCTSESLYAQKLNEILLLTLNYNPNIGKSIVQKIMQRKIIKSELTFIRIAEACIEANQLDLAKSVLDHIDESETFRLRAWIARLEKKDLEADAFLSKYYETLNFENAKSVKYSLIPLEMPKNIPNDLEEALDDLQHFLDSLNKKFSLLSDEYGINKNTCLDVGCVDCCTKTFPYISYAEYLLLVRFINLGDESLKDSLINESKSIIKDFKQRFMQEPNFIFEYSVDNPYPTNYSFNCVFLRDSKCMAYNQRPFMCRSFGYGSLKGMFKACSYYINQFKFANSFEDRKLIDMNDFYSYIKAFDAKFLGQSVLAPIPFWFASDIDELKRKINQ